MVMDKLKLALIVTVLALVAGLWYSVRANGALSARAQTAEKALQTAQKQRKTDAKVVAAAQVEKRSQAGKSAGLEKRVSEAAGGDETWAGTSVPPDVRSALLEAVEGLE